MHSTDNPIADALIRLGSAAQAAGLTHLIIGGNAVIHHGVPRFTRDVDFLIPETTCEAWHTFLLNQGYVLFHSAGTFFQYESVPGISDQPPLDLMAVDVGTWEKLFAAAETESLAADYLAHWPAPLHLIALKLHAWRGVFREEKEQDWNDMLGLIRQCDIDIHDASFREIVSRYGGPEALARFGIVEEHGPEHPA